MSQTNPQEQKAMELVSLFQTLTDKDKDTVLAIMQTLAFAQATSSPPAQADNSVPPGSALS